MYTQYGVREICDVVMRAKYDMTIGSKEFKRDDIVFRFDSLKTSTLEGAVTTVYATGGKGNSRLIAWDGERTVTFTMEDALISPITMAMLTGAGVVESGETNEDDTATAYAIVHTSEIVTATTNSTLVLNKIAYVTEDSQDKNNNNAAYIYFGALDENGALESKMTKVTAGDSVTIGDNITTISESTIEPGKNYIVDYYVKQATKGVTTINIEVDKFGGNYYLEGSTLWRDRDGQDKAAEYIIPNCKVQSNFTFSMAASGDPGTFTFTMDAFPAIPKFSNKKVLAAIQIVDDIGNGVKADEQGNA